MKKLVGTLLFVFTANSAQAADSFPMGSDLLRMLWALLIVIGIILIIFGLAKKRFGLGSLQPGAIKVLELRRIMPKNTLALIEVRGKVILIGLGAEQITLLQNFHQEASGKTKFEALLDKQQ